MTALVQSKAGVSISQALPVFNAFLPAKVIEELVTGTPKRFYDRLYSPLASFGVLFSSGSTPITVAMLSSATSGVVQLII